MLARYCGISLLFMFVIAPRAAHAGNDDDLFVGNQAAMLGGAVSATVADSSSTWYNPAGLGAVQRDQVDVSATVYTLRLYSVPDFIASTTGESDDGGVGEFVVAPSQIAYVRRLGSEMSLGLGYFVPRASNYVLRETLDAGRSAERQHWQLAAAITDVQHVGAAAIGFAVTPRVRVGFSLIGGYQTSSSAVSLFGSVQSNRQPAAAVSSAVIGTESHLTMELGFGVQLNLTDSLVIGISARSPQLQLHNDLDEVNNVVLTSLRDPTAPILGTDAVRDQSNEGIDLRKSGRAGLAIAYVYDTGRIGAEVDVQPALRRPDLEINRKTVVNARAGWYHSLGTTVAFGVGLFTDRASEAKSWDIVGGSGDFYGATAGLEFTNEHLLAASERADSLVFTGVFALRYAYSDGDFGTLVFNPDAIESEPFESVKGGIQVHEFGFYVGSGLRF